MEKVISETQLLYEEAMENFICNGEVDKSINLMELIISEKPGYIQVYYDLGFLYNIKGDNKKSVAYYEKYLDLNPIALDRIEILEMIVRLKNEMSLKNRFKNISFAIFPKLFNRAFKPVSSRKNELKQFSY